MAMNAASFRRGDLYRNQGRNTAESANTAMMTQEVKHGSGGLGAANQGAPQEGSAAGVLIVLILIFAAIRVVAHQTGDENDYSGIAPSFYNIMLITLASMLGGTLLKLAAVKMFAPNNALRNFIVQG